MKNDHRSKFSNLSNWKKEAWKNQGFNGIRTRDLRVKIIGFLIFPRLVRLGKLHLFNVFLRDFISFLH